MKVVFVSNYINHHQIPFSEAMCKYLQEEQGEYYFIQTEPMEAERLDMGWNVDADALSYVLKYYECREKCEQLLLDAQIVIFGGTMQRELIVPRLELRSREKVTFFNTERLYKEGQWKFISPKGLIAKYKEYLKYHKDNVHLMCAGAYVASDFSLIHAFPGKKYKWGYFPRFEEMDIEALVAEKEAKVETTSRVEFLWTGRFIDWKHPDYAIRLMKDLHEATLKDSSLKKVHLTMVGGGDMQLQLEKLVSEYHLEEIVTLKGFMKPDEVREYMKNSNVYLMTSDYKEGWGAVVNEAMNSGCMVVCGHGAGATGYLVEDKINGVIYDSGNYDTLLENVKSTYNNSKLRKEMALRAYATIRMRWNADNAAKNFLKVSKALLEGHKADIPSDEPMALSDTIPQSKMYRHLKRAVPQKLSARKRVYVCHTFYHVYVSMLKECRLRRNAGLEYRKADLILSTMSIDFGNIKERIEKNGFFENVFWFHEKRYTEIPHLLKYKKDRGLILNILQRIRYERLLSKEQEKYVPVDFKAYQEIYVFCDIDPIGYYLNFHKIRYHAMEDGLDCLVLFDDARYDNRGAFNFKVKLAEKNIIFIQNGYAKYCIDMEVNDLSKLKYTMPKYVECPHKLLVEELNDEDKDDIVSCFLENADDIRNMFADKAVSDKAKILVLTEEILEPEVRETMVGDVIRQYGDGKMVFIKPHPRDQMDYKNIFPDCTVFDRKFPMEMFNYIKGLHFNQVYSFLTVLSAIEFADECINLGNDFVDIYAKDGRFRYNEKI